MVQSTQVLKNGCHFHKISKLNSKNRKVIGFPPKSVHRTIIHEELIRSRSTEVFKFFLHTYFHFLTHLYLGNKFKMFVFLVTSFIFVTYQIKNKFLGIIIY